MSNTLISDLLFQLAKQREEDNDTWRARSMQKAASAIKKYPDVIESGADAVKNIKGVGKGVAKRIDEILENGSLLELKLDDSKIQQKNAIKQLLTITGIGPTRAKKYVNEMNIVSIDDLKAQSQQGKIKLTHHIEMGLKYYDDLEHRIPYDEILQFKSLYQAIFSEISDNIIWDVCGSHRRGQTTSGDMDVLFTLKNRSSKDKKNYLKLAVKSMKNANILVDDLTLTGNTKYMGFCKLSEGMLSRRIDIRYVPFKSYYTALLYFTGSKKFNVDMRNIAIQKGYSLSEYSMTNTETGDEIMFNSEKEIFDLLDMTYCLPHDRNEE
jgi:DNA polymerase/3'-5' exonuclease PolX